MKSRSIFIVVVFIFLVAFQQSGIVFVKSLPAKGEFITTDNLSNIYLLNNDVLQKYNSQGIPLKSYSNKTLGKITTVDAINPMKVVLFYRSFLQIVFLDNTLSQNGDPVSIEKLGYPQTQLVCSSHNNGIWIYNQQNFELIRFDQDLQVVNQTGNLAQLLGIAVKPTYMVQYNNQLYVNNPSTGILVFDAFGTYSKTIPLKNITVFQFKEDQILYYQEGKVNTFNMHTLEQGRSQLLDSTAISVALGRNNLYLLQKDTLRIYSVK